MTAVAVEQLRISPTLSLPLDAITQTFLIVGKKGSGKSNAGVVLAEEAIKVGSRFSSLEPVGHWWGLKARPDGSPGFPIYVFGGPHQDLPLEPTAGALMAQVVAESAASIVLCTAEFSGGERARFVADYATEFLKLMLSRRFAPILQVLEEADTFAPQRPMKGEERMLGAIDKLVRQVRQGGAGVALITQRAAALNKNVTTQADNLVAFRTIGPQDRDAIDEWIKYHEAGARRKEVLETLATLRDGESWLWSPEKLEYFDRVQWRRRETFDAAATPKVGEKIAQPQLADVDLEQLRGKMAATIERAKADDPKELRRRIAELERQVADKKVVSAAVVERVEVPVLTAEQVEDLRHVVDLADQRAEYTRNAADQLSAAADLINRLLPSPAKNGASVAVPTAHAVKPRAAAPPRTLSPDVDVTQPQQRILDALARLAAVRVDEPLKTQVALFAGVSPTSSGFTNNLGALRSSGLIHYPRAGYVGLTDAGRAAANPVEVPVSSAELQAAVSELVGGGKWRLLKVLIDIYPRSIDKPLLAERAGVSPTSSGFTNNLGALRSLGFLDYPQPGYVAAEPVLFVEEAMVSAR